MTNLWKRLSVLLGMLFASLAFTAAPASAQATRTWVSGVGDDVNPCSRTAPCKTFAGAISKTAAGGEINCLDPGGWGAVTITKAITIDCSQFPGGILNAGSNGIIVNAGATDVVTIRGLEIQGGSTSSPGLNGIRFIAGGALILEDMVIRGSVGSNGSGIVFAPTAASRLFLNHVSVTNNGNGTGAGILLQPSAGGSAQVVIQNSQISSGATTGIRADASSLTGGSGVTFQLTNSVVTGNNVGVFLFSGTGGAPVKAMIVDTTISNNVNTGILVNGGTATAVVSGTTITGNGQGVVASGGPALSYGDNRLFGNATSNAFTSTIAKN